MKPGYTTLCVLLLFLMLVAALPDRVGAASWMKPLPEVNTTFEEHKYDIIVKLGPPHQRGTFSISLPVGWLVQQAGNTSLSYYVINQSIPYPKCSKFMFQAVMLTPQMKQQNLTPSKGDTVLSSEVFQADYFSVKRSTVAPYPGNKKLHIYNLALMGGENLISLVVEGLEEELQPIINVMEHVACSVKLDGKGTGVVLPKDPKASVTPSTNLPLPAPSSPKPEKQIADAATIPEKPDMEKEEMPPGIVKATWLGKVQDKVGPWAQVTADGTPDLCFGLRLNVPKKETIDYVNLYKCDVAGNRGPEHWLSRDYNRAWILGVSQGGNLLNPTLGSNLGAHEGLVHLELYANDSGIATESAFFQIEASVGGTIYKAIVSTEVKTKLVRTETGKGTAVAAGHGKHKFSLHGIDTSMVKAPGMLVVDVEIGNTAMPVSVELFGENQVIPTAGIPVSLLHAYDLQPGTNTQLKHRFSSGEIFKLGFGGSWAAPPGSTNTYAFKCSIHQDDMGGDDSKTTASSSQNATGPGPAENTTRPQNTKGAALDFNGRWEDASGRVFVISLSEKTIQAIGGSVRYTYSILAQESDGETLLIKAKVHSLDVDLPPDYPEVLAEADREAAKKSQQHACVRFKIVPTSTGAVEISEKDNAPVRFVKS